MKRKLLAMAVACATLALLVMPSASATESSGEVNVDSGGYTLSLGGAYQNGIYFKFATTDLSTTKSAASDSAGTTPLTTPATTDYVEVRSEAASDMWAVYISSTDFGDGVTTYELDASTGASNIQLLNSKTGGQTTEFVTTTGNGCAPTNGTNIIHTQIADTITSASATHKVFEGTNTGNYYNGCSLYTARTLVPLTMDSPTQGFAPGTYTGTITFEII